MTDGATNAGSIYQGDFDTWTFTATQGDYIALSVGTVTQTTAHFAFLLMMRPPPRSTLFPSTTLFRSSNIAATAPTSGTYTVIIGSYVGGFYDGTGSYLLTLAKGPGARKVTPLNSSHALTTEAANAFSIYQGDFDTWTFTATQGDYIALSVGTETQTTAHFAFFFNDTATTEIYPLSLHDALPISNIAATAPTSGTYTVIIGSYVGGFYDGTGSYLLTLAKGP